MNKTEEILQILRNELQRGVYAQGALFASEPKLVKRFSVSRITINKITEQLVREGYLQRGSKGSGTRVLNTAPYPLGSIAYLGPYQNPYYDLLQFEIQKNAMERGYAVNAFYQGSYSINQCLEMIARNRYLGLICCGIGMVPENFPLPVVYVDQPVPDDSIPRCSVCINDYETAFAVIDDICRKGHREIAVLSNYSYIEYNRQRRQRGFLDAMVKNGIPHPENRIFSDPVNNVFEAKMFWKKLLTAYPETTVLVTDSNMPAWRLHAANLEHKKPNKVIITGFSSSPMQDKLYHFPSVDQHPDQLASCAITELLYNAEHPDKPHLDETIVPASLVNFDRIPVNPTAVPKSRRKG
ncbi:MAG: substrate-binding domain-containing protein [Lentisphaeria bacterium]|nr:substrate-binding domain-containing protein [Lentisphaeria bacterium]